MVVFTFAEMGWLLTLPHLRRTRDALCRVFAVGKCRFCAGRWSHRTPKAPSRLIPTRRTRWWCLFLPEWVGCWRCRRFTAFETHFAASLNGTASVRSTKQLGERIQHRRLTCPQLEGICEASNSTIHCSEPRNCREADCKRRQIRATTCRGAIGQCRPWNMSRFGATSSYLKVQ